MIISSYRLPVMGLLCVMTLASCGLIAEPGPRKEAINKGSDSFQVVHVNSEADFPGAAREYGLSQTPPAVKGEPYSDKIRPRDTLHFIITDLAEESPFHTKGDAYRVGPLEVPEDGRVELPYIGAVQLLNLTLSQASAELDERVKPVSNTARTSVFRSNRLPKTANVIGDVRKPGQVPLERSQITSMDLLAAAGGPKDAEHLYTYTLRRGTTDYSFDYLGFRRSAFHIEEGDLLTVTPDAGNRFHVMGATHRTSTVAFPVPAPTLADAFGASGLDSQRSDPSGVFVFRLGSPDLVYTFDLRQPRMIHLMQRFPIRGNDVIYVTEAPLARWNRLISQIMPTSVSQAVNAASRYSNN